MVGIPTVLHDVAQLHKILRTRICELSGMTGSFFWLLGCAAGQREVRVRVHATRTGVWLGIDCVVLDVPLRIFTAGKGRRDNGRQATAAVRASVAAMPAPGGFREKTLAGWQLPSRRNSSWLDSVSCFETTDAGSTSLSSLVPEKLRPSCWVFEMIRNWLSRSTGREAHTGWLLSEKCSFKEVTRFAVWSDDTIVHSTGIPKRKPFVQLYTCV